MRKSLFYLLIIPPVSVLALAVEASGPARFSHKLHLEQGAECKTCHDLEGIRPAPGKFKGCQDCHDKEPGFAASPARKKSSLEFPHVRHAKKLDCQSCHASIKKDVVDDTVSYASCQNCHRDQGIAVSAACASCHGKDLRKIRPEDHRGQWLERHGEESRWHEGEHGLACDQCHGQAACGSCHRIRRPRNHTSLWRMRMHGKEAEWDRDRCLVCHESGNCIRCHKTTRPLTHQGDWTRNHGLLAVDMGNRYCAVCHAPGHCKTCH